MFKFFRTGQNCSWDTGFGIYNLTADASAYCRSLLSLVFVPVCYSLLDDVRHCLLSKLKALNSVTDEEGQGKR